MTDKVLLDEYDVVEGLMQKMANIPFVNELGESVYVVDVERTDVNTLVVEATDGTKFTITCEGAVPDEHNAEFIQKA